MEREATKRREVVVAHAAGHADPVVREAAEVMLQEIAVLRGLVEEGGLPDPSLNWRRVIGRVVSALLILLGAAVISYRWNHDTNALAFRQGFEDGYRAAVGPANYPPAKRVK